MSYGVTALESIENLLNFCIKCTKCKYLTYNEEQDYCECAKGIEVVMSFSRECKEFEKKEVGE